MITLQKAVSLVSGEQQQKLMHLRSLVASECPQIVKALHLIDQEYSTIKNPKGFNLMKRDSKKHKFLYYVRYYHEGKMVPSKWCTHTNDHEAACEFARKNREALLAKYFGKNGKEVERFFTAFYNPDNPVFKNECAGMLKFQKAKESGINRLSTISFFRFL